MHALFSISFGVFLALIHVLHNLLCCIFNVLDLFRKAHKGRLVLWQIHNINKLVNHKKRGPAGNYSTLHKILLHLWLLMVLLGVLNRRLCWGKYLLSQICWKWTCDLVNKDEDNHRSGQHIGRAGWSISGNKFLELLSSRLKNANVSKS